MFWGYLLMNMIAVVLSAFSLILHLENQVESLLMYALRVSCVCVNVFIGEKQKQIH